MPQGSRYDENGKLLWRFDICVEFDCNEEYAAAHGAKGCGSDFTKEPCLFLGEHLELNEPDKLREDERMSEHLNNGRTE